MALDLGGQRALVTGAGRRVGRAIAVALGRAGMHVAVHFHESARGADDTCREVERGGGSAFPVQADLRDRAAVRNLVDEAGGRLGGLDLLVASAAGYERLAFDGVDDGAWDRMLELNLTAQFVLASRAAPLLRASRGSIVFVTCSSSKNPIRNHLPYVVSKGALRHLMRTLALELAPDVRVNAVAPGTVLPPPDMAADRTERIRRRIPLGHFGQPEDVARAVVFLASSPFVTGEEIAVDGGRGLS